MVCQGGQGLAFFILLLLAAANLAQSSTLQDTLLTLHAEYGVGSEATICDDRKRRKNTLKLIKEMPFTGLFRDLRNQSIFEASGLEFVPNKPDGPYFVVFDNSMSIGTLDDGFHFRGPANKLIGDKGEESQFEGITYVRENDTFLLLQENIEHEDKYQPHILTAKITKDGDRYDIIQHCLVNFEMSHENKGFECIQHITNSRGGWLLGLCEGNKCTGGAEGREAGNGRIVASRLQFNVEGHECMWMPEYVIKIPERAHFTDYSAMAFRGSKLAILSQEDAAVWIGDFDREALEFLSEGQVFHFPKDNHCETIYCNLEGIEWIDDRRVIVTSDKAKRYQPFYCDAKDQMVHIFSLPATYDPSVVVDPINRPSEL